MCKPTSRPCTRPPDQAFAPFDLGFSPYGATGTKRTGQTAHAEPPSPSLLGIVCPPRGPVKRHPTRTARGLSHAGPPTSEFRSAAGRREPAPARRSGPPSGGDRVDARLRPAPNRRRAQQTVWVRCGCWRGDTSRHPPPPTPVLALGAARAQGFRAGAPQARAHLRPTSSTGPTPPRFAGRPGRRPPASMASPWRPTPGPRSPRRTASATRPGGVRRQYGADGGSRGRLPVPPSCRAALPKPRGRCGGGQWAGTPGGLARDSTVVRAIVQPPTPLPEGRHPSVPPQGRVVLGESLAPQAIAGAGRVRRVRPSVAPVTPRAPRPHRGAEPVRGKRWQARADRHTAPKSPPLVAPSGRRPPLE